MDSLEYKMVTSEREMRGALEVRRRVFVVEQGISETVEMDGNDSQARHMVVMDRGRAIATARLRFLPDHQVKLERMAVLKPQRRKGIGKGIVSFLDTELKKSGVELIVLHAQYPVIDFYRSCGFKETGLPFLEAGIKHIRMEKKL